MSAAPPLLVRFGALGDMVLMTVPIRILSDRFGCRVDVLSSGAWTQPLLQGQPGVGEIFLLGSRKTPYGLSRDQQRLVRSLRERGAGPTWLFDARNDKTRWLLQRAGWQTEQLALLHKVPDIEGEHFCDRWRRFALLDPPLLGGAQHPGAGGPATPQLHLSADSRVAVTRWLHAMKLADRPFILIQVGNKRTMRRGARRRRSNTKYWPERQWAALLSTLRVLHPSHALLLLGTTPEARLNDEIVSMAHLDHIYNLAREMTVPRLVGLAERAAGMISVDTGPAHVAAAVGCPVLTLFESAAKARMYAPRGPEGVCRRVIVSTAPHPSLRSISTQEVLASWRAMSLRTGKAAGDTLATRAIVSSRAVER